MSLVLSCLVLSCLVCFFFLSTSLKHQTHSVLFSSTFYFDTNNLSTIPTFGSPIFWPYWILISKLFMNIIQSLLCPSLLISFLLSHSVAVSMSATVVCPALLTYVSSSSSRPTAEPLTPHRRNVSSSMYKCSTCNRSLSFFSLSLPATPFLCWLVCALSIPALLESTLF